jgi:hypothetical protein
MVLFRAALPLSLPTALAIPLSLNCDALRKLLEWAGRLCIRQEERCRGSNSSSVRFAMIIGTNRQEVGSPWTGSRRFSLLCC